MCVFKKSMATFSSFEDAWGPGPASEGMMANTPQKSFAGGNAPQKSMANGAPPQKVFSSGDAADQRDVALAGMMEHTQRQSKEIVRLERMVNSLVQENAAAKQMAATNRPKGGLSVLEISVIVIALVFIVLVLYLIRLVSGLTK